MRAFDAAILGFVEGLTEYLPISSTGHLILSEHFLGIAEDPSAKTFAIAIQLGAIVAVVVLYRDYLLGKLRTLFRGDPVAVQFFANLLIAFVPVAVVGLLAGSWIKEKLFSVPSVLAALVVGALIMIVSEWTLGGKRQSRSVLVEQMRGRDALLVGLCQILSLWPGFSRAMATILGGRFVGLDPKGASEFSFFLALPTLGAATCYEMLKAFKSGGAGFDGDWWPSLVIGLLISFVTALLVIKTFLVFLQRYSLVVFAYYRIFLALVIYLIFLK